MPTQEARPDQKPNLTAAWHSLAEVFYEVGGDVTCDEALLEMYAAHPGFNRDEPNFGFKERVLKVKAQLAGNLPVAAMAEKPQVNPANPINLSSQEIEKKLSRAKSTRTVGLLTTLIFGTSALFFGLDAALSKKWGYGSGYMWETGILKINRTGSLIACGGAALFTAIGIINWSRGQKHLKQLKKEKKDLQIGLDIQPNMKHYGISLAFIF